MMAPTRIGEGASVGNALREELAAHDEPLRPEAPRKPVSLGTAEDIAEIFRALADPTRVRIVSVLADAELSVGELAEALDMTLSAVSHQLGLLRGLHVVRARRDGRFVYYSLDDEHVYSLYRRALEHAAHCTDESQQTMRSGDCDDN